MIIASFDIGIYNLAYCVLSVDSCPDCKCNGDASLAAKILDWGILCTKDTPNKVDMNTIARNLIALLFEKLSDQNYNIDVVLIENQPCMKNPTMKSVQMIVYTFFMMQNHINGQNIDVKFISAGNKMKVKYKCDTSSITSASKYQVNKKTVVMYAMHYLELTKDVNGSWIDVFMKEKKRDDLADCYAQALHYIENMK
jgi:hypothetical protein